MKKDISALKENLVRFIIDGKIKKNEFGRFESETDWRRQIRGITVKWAKKLPVTEVTEHFNHPFLARIIGLHQNTNLQSWQIAGLFAGLSEIGEKEIIKQLTSQFIDKKGKWISPPKEVDFALLSYELLKNEENSELIFPAMKIMYQAICQNIGCDGTVLYRKNIDGIRFVDTVGMICSFLLLYGEKYNDKESVNLAYHQISGFLEKGLDSNGLPFHAYSLVTGDKLGIGSWCRGIGWLSLGFSEFIALNNTSEQNLLIIEKAIGLADNLLNYQNECGGFSWMVTEKGRTESSGTALLGNFYLDLFEKFNKEDYLSAAKKCQNSLMLNTANDGIIWFAQGDSKAVGLYSHDFKAMPFAQGYTLKLASRLYRLSQLDSYREPLIR